MLRSRILRLLALSSVALLGPASTVRADRYDETLRLLGYGHEPINDVIDSVLLSGSQRLAERLMTRIPDIHPRRAAFGNQRRRFELVLLGNPKRLQMPAPDRGLSILAAAVSSNAVDVVRVLLERELDTKNEKAQLDRAIKEGRESVVAVYCEFERLKPLLAEALHTACWRQKPAIAKRIIATGVDVTFERTWGFQAIHAAMYRRDVELVELLLSKGAAEDVFIAAGRGRLAQMNELMKAGVPSKFRNSVAPHPAYFAARAGELATLEPFLGNRSVVRGSGFRGFNLLIAAAGSGSGEVIQRLIEAGVPRDNLATLESDKKSHALHFAASNGNIEAIRALLKAGVDIEFATERGTTPLCMAADFGQLEAAKVLLAEGAAVDAPRNRTESPLWIAAGEGRVEMAKLLLENGASIDGVGKSPLRAALSAGRVEVAKLLLEKGSNVLATVPAVDPAAVTTTPLGLVARRKAELVQMFLDLGQDPNRLQGDPKLERTPVLAAVQGFSPGNAKLLLRAGGRVRPRNHWLVLYFAGRNGDVELLDALLRSGVSLTSRQPDQKETGLQALMRGAIEADRKDVLRYVASLGIDLDIALQDGNTPLAMAATRYARQTLIALLQSGADPHAKPTPKSRSAMEIASKFVGGFEIVRILVQHGATPTETNGWHLVRAAAEGDVHHIADLLEMGYAVNGPDDHGDALLVAATNGRLDVVSLLLDRGADPTLRDVAGRTALHGAVESDTRTEELVDLLLAAGADPNIADNNGVLPLHLAFSGKRKAIIEKLAPWTEITGLHLAAAMGDVESVRRILAADPDAVHTERAPLGTPLFWAASTSREDVVRLLLNSGGATRALHDAMPDLVKGGDIGLIAFLAEHGVSVNGPVKQYGEPLRLAIHTRNPELVRVLLDHHANPNASVGSWTPLQRAATRGLPDIAELLIAAGAHVNGVGYSKKSALDLALDPSAYATASGENTRSTRGTVEGKLAVARLLLDSGARARAGKPGKVEYAASVGALDIVKRLLATGGDPNGVDTRRRLTPLVSAIQGRSTIMQRIDDPAERERLRETYVDVVRTLLEAGADPESKSQNGGTPLETANRHRDETLIEIIETAIAKAEKDSE